jgi:hypothetical protein
LVARRQPFQNSGLPVFPTSSMVAVGLLALENTDNTDGSWVIAVGDLKDHLFSTAEREGFESAVKRIFNSLAGPG